MAEKREFLHVLLFSLLVAVVFASHALAQEDFDDAEEEVVESEEEVLVEDRAGITPDSPLYVFDKAIDEVQLRASSGEEKSKKALEIKEERIAEAAVMVDENKPDAAKSALDLASKASQQAQKDIAPDLEKEANENVRKAARLLSGLQEKLPEQGWEGVEKAINAQLNEEEKVRVAVLVSKSRLSYCDAIAKQDYDLMKGDELCQLEKAPDWLRGRVEGEFREREEGARRQILDSVSTCIVDPKKCDCSQIPVAKHSQDCEVKKALAIRCEYENDNEACASLSEETPDELLPEFVGEEGKGTILDLLRKKEKQMFERFRPPECEAAATFEDCFRIMKGLYGEPLECEGMSDEECMEFVKRHPPTEKPNLPPECSEAGVTKPVECAELMFSKYGMPPQCEGLDTKECMKLMRQERPDAMQRAMPPECQEAGVKEPRQCFDVMTAKYGMPPECEGLGADDCFKEMMKRGPGEGPDGGQAMEEPPECKEKGLRGKDCFLAMMELYGAPQECEGLSTDECFEVIRKQPPTGTGGECVGLSPEECRAKMQEIHGIPPECAQNPGDCRDAFAGRGVPGGVPAECAGLEPRQCDLVMMQKFGPRECREVTTKEECEEITRQKYEEAGFGGAPGGGPGPAGGDFVNDCEGLAREECEQKMFERFSPPECQDVPREECSRNMRERFERERREQDENVRECEGLSEDECRQKLGERFREPGERRFEGGGFGGGGMPGEVPSGCEGLSPDECSKVMRERTGPEQRFPSGAMPGEEKAFPDEMAERIPRGTREGHSGFPAESPSLPREPYEPMQQAPREAMEQRREFDSGFGGPVQHEASGEFSEPQPSQPEEPERHKDESSGGEVLDVITGSIVKIAEWLKE